MIPRNSSSTTSTEKKSIRIWLVDDNHDYRNLMMVYLQGEPGLGCSRQFSSAEAVLAALADGVAPDVILIDLNMGKLSGLDAIRPIRSLARSTQVILLTCFHDEHSRRQALSSGAADFLVKTGSLTDIPERIRRAWEHREAATPIHKWDQLEAAKICPEQTQSRGAPRSPEVNQSGIAPRPPALDSQRQLNSWRCASSRIRRSMGYLRALLDL